DGKRERLTDPLILSELRLGPVAVADVDRYALIAETRYRDDLQSRISLDRLDIARRQPLDHVELARAQVRKAHGRIGNDAERHVVEGVLIGLPVIGEAGQYDAIVLDALDELVGARADRARPHRLVEARGRQQHAGAIRKLGEQGRVRSGQLEDDRLGI